MDFLYYFATVTNETHPGLARVEGSPVAGEGLCFFGFLPSMINDVSASQPGICLPLVKRPRSCCHSPGVPAFLVLAVTGLAPDEEASFSHVMLLGADGQSLQQVKLNSSSSSSSSSVEELVGRVDSVPRVPFCVRLTGRDSRGNKLERVSTEMVQPTHVQIQVIVKLNKTCAAF